MTAEEKLLNKRSIVNMGYITPCWLYTGALGHNGYGIIYINGIRNLRVHVEAAKLWLPNYNPNKWVLHKCDIRKCFNPEHLFQGNQFDNMRDCVEKRRHKNSSKTHCIRGHEFTPENTIIRQEVRQCRICEKNRQDSYNLRRK
jgi:hypothetical protein